MHRFGNRSARPAGVRCFEQRLRAAAAAALSAPFVRGAFAAGKLSVGFWDHWVPGANNTLTKLCKEWADKDKVEITIDYITSQGDKLILTGAAEAQARSGHDMLTFLAWAGAAQADALAPLDDIMAELIKAMARCRRASTTVAKQNGHWIAVPAPVGSPTLPPCARIDYFKEYVGLDLPNVSGRRAARQGTRRQMDLGQFSRRRREMPQGRARLRHAARRHQRRGRLGLCGAARLRRADGRQGRQHHGQVRRDEAGAGMVPEAGAGAAAERLRLGRCLEQQVADLRAGRADHEPAFGLGGGGARRAEGRRAALDLPDPEGTEGPVRPGRAVLLGRWSFSKNIPAAKSLLAYLCQRSSVEQTVAASKGYDIPPFAKLHDFKTWAEEEPPKGTIYNYPPRGDVQVVIPYSESPTKIANQIYAQATVPKMIAQCTQQGKTIDRRSIGPPAELEGFSRS